MSDTRPDSAEEKNGKVRWLRPDFQNLDGATTTTQAELPGPKAKKVAKKKTAAKTKKQPWPKSLPDKITAVRDALSSAAKPLAAKDIAKLFTRANKERLGEVLDTLTALGHAVEAEGSYTSP